MPKIRVKVVIYIFAAFLLMLGGLLTFWGYYTSHINHGEIDAGSALIGIGLVIWVSGYIFRRRLK
jgi:uncharacterized membrane protein